MITDKELTDIAEDVYYTLKSMNELDNKFDGSMHTMGADAVATVFANRNRKHMLTLNNMLSVLQHYLPENQREQSREDERQDEARASE